jgi:hypothetical protein
MVLLVPVAVFDSIVSRSVDVVLHFLVSRDLVSSDAVEELVLLSDGEAISVHPGSPDAFEGSVQVFLVVLGALDQADVGQFCDVLCALGVGVASEYADGVPAAFGKRCGCCKYINIDTGRRRPSTNSELLAILEHLCHR